MKLHCGLTYKGWRMRRESWRRWFAWRPVVVSVDEHEQKTCVWLEWVERRGRWHAAALSDIFPRLGYWPHSHWVFGYRAPGGE